MENTNDLWLLSIYDILVHKQKKYHVKNHFISASSFCVVMKKAESVSTVLSLPSVRHTAAPFTVAPQKLLSFTCVERLKLISACCCEFGFIITFIWERNVHHFIRFVR